MLYATLRCWIFNLCLLLYLLQDSLTRTLIRRHVPSHAMLTCHSRLAFLRGSHTKHIQVLPKWLSFPDAKKMKPRRQTSPFLQMCTAVQLCWIGKKKTKKTNCSTHLRLPRTTYNHHTITKLCQMAELHTRLPTQMLGNQRQELFWD